MIVGLGCGDSEQSDATENTGATEGLKDVASFPIGTAMNIRRMMRDTQLRNIQLANFNSITAENDMKMQNISRGPGQYNFEQADMMVAFAEEHDLRLFGHALVWHSSTPDWVQGISKDTAALGGFLKEYITTYVSRYKGKVDGWDVVNEVMATSGGEYRETFWYEAFGIDYVARAFRYAHEADPEAVLFYNDFNIERDTAKLDGALEMIRQLRADGVPISGLGFQMHIRMDIPDETIAYALKKGAETGLQIHLSEVDIIFNKHDDTQSGGVQVYDEITDELLKAQGEKYQRVVEMYREIVPEEQQYGITFWGFNDRDSWVDGFFGIEDAPCLFDDDLEPKPAYHGVKEGLVGSG